ncbi:A-kinase anchor protein 7, putative [Ixodes scapularis]|uniref:A-kinase anchor protein 7, putative n=1 Tax=Ixodes scapularis TaxID=6945 RepID=B7PGV1_IXOSC|nr:A-kinase anchor protein 7, putative [Ixodes scapularis]|eukprot:XP_002401460.1 A-kinase anchor protein 7, putative [Ixodes scapularis]
MFEIATNPPPDISVDDFEQAPLTLEFKGLANFGGKVLYVKTADEGAHGRLQTLSDVCLEEFVKANLDLSAHKDFKPHLTLAKLSRVTKRERVVKRIEAEWYSEFAEESFGSQRVNGVQLLSMNKPKDERGYYYNSLQLDFEPTEKTGPHDADHTECCRPFVVASQTVSSSLQKKHKLLQELESAKQEVKRKVSSVTEDALKRMAGSASVETTSEDGQE